MKNIFFSLMILSFATAAQATDFVQSVQRLVPNGRYEGKTSDNQACIIEVKATENDIFWGGKPSINVTISPKEDASKMRKVVYVKNHPRFKVSKMDIKSSGFYLESVMAANEQSSSSKITKLQLEAHSISIQEKTGMFSWKSLSCQF